MGKAKATSPSSTPPNSHTSKEKNWQEKEEEEEEEFSFSTHSLSFKTSPSLALSLPPLLQMDAFDFIRSRTLAVLLVSHLLSSGAFSLLNLFMLVRRAHTCLYILFSITQIESIVVKIKTN